jgi:hypothetical protein
MTMSLATAGLAAAEAATQAEVSAVAAEVMAIVVVEAVLQAVLTAATHRIGSNSKRNRERFMARRTQDYYQQ